jgi:D-aspartate ligase
MVSSPDLPTGKVIVAGMVHGGLAIARSLARHGVRVIGVTAHERESGLRSNAVHEHAICPDPADERAFVDFLLSRADSWSGALIIETNDYYSSALANHREELERHYRLAVPSAEVTATFIEKDLTYELAEQCGVEYPALVLPESPAELEEVIGQLQFPVMLKPVRSHEFAARFRKKLFVTETPEDLRERFSAANEAGLATIVCEIIPGDDHRTLEKAWYYVGSDGQILVEIHNTKLRQTPPMFGITRAAVTTPVNEEIRSLALSILDASDLRGTAGFEFKRDPRDGRPKLIEVNIRVMADVQMMISAGVDIPWIMYRDLVLDEREPPPEYAIGQYYVYELPDIFQFLGRRNPRSIRAFLEPYRTRRRSFAYFSLRDPRPFVHEVTKRIRRKRQGAEAREMAH